MIARAVAVMTASLMMLSSASSAFAQAPPARQATHRWIIERWGSDQGLPQNTVTSIAQTPDGYMWIGTNGGLVRFDGVKFRPYTATDFAPFASNRITALRTTPDGTLWIATDRTLVSYANGEFREHGEAAGRPPGRTTFMFADESGVWLTTTIGLGHLAARDARFETFVDRGVPADWTGEIARDRSGHVWVESRRAGFLVMRAGTREFVRANIPSKGRTLGPETRSLAHDGNPIFRTTSGAFRWTGAFLAPLGISGTMTGDGRGGYWSVDRDGVWHADSLGRAQLVDSAGAPRSAFTIFVDREGTLWVGTMVNGLLRMRPRVVRMYLRENGLGVEQVAAVLRDTRNRLWVGSSCGATSMMRGDSFTVMRNPGCAYSVAETPDGTVWFGSYGGGVNRLGSNGTLTLNILRGRLPNPIVLALFGDADSSLWIGTERGLVHFSRDSIRTFLETDGLPTPEIHFITRDRQGALWVGTGGGLAKLEGSRFRSWTARDSLPPGAVRAVYQDADGHYWIGTYGGGLARFDGTRFVTISMQHGLFDNVVSSIHEDRNGNLWMGGNRGIFRAARADLDAFAEGRSTDVRSVGYGPSDGLLTVETNGGFQPSSWQDKDGRLWFATVRGLASIDPAVAAPITDPPRVAIESFNVDGKAMSPNGIARLPVGSRYIEIGYTGLTSLAPERLAFRYRLAPFDPGWVYANERRVAYYSSPPPGTYTFTVAAAGREGTWSDATKQFSFVVPAPLYQTAWFRAFIGLLAAAGIAGAVRWRIAHAHERERLQREFTRHVLQGQEQERGRLAGELHDSLGQDLLIMKNRAAIALRAPDLPLSVQPHLVEIASVAAQAVEHAREMSHNLRPHHLDNFGLAASLRDLADRARGASHLLIDVDMSEGEGRVAPEHSIQLFRIAQESLNNVIKHAGATSVTITLRVDGTGARLLVSDDGRGMDVTTKGAFGLAGMRQRVQLLGGTFDVRSIVDAGTTIDVFVPAGSPL